jgi:hypothetical protein
MFPHEYLNPHFVARDYAERQLVEETRRAAEVLGEGVVSDALRNAEQFGGYYSLSMQTGGPQSLPMVVHQLGPQAANEHVRRQALLTTAAAAPQMIGPAEATTTAPPELPQPTRALADDDALAAPTYVPRHANVATPDAAPRTAERPSALRLRTLYMPPRQPPLPVRPSLATSLASAIRVRHVVLGGVSVTLVGLGLFVHPAFLLVLLVLALVGLLFVVARA